MKTFIIAASTIFLIGCSSTVVKNEEDSMDSSKKPNLAINDQEKPTAIKWIEYRDEELGFKINYPEFVYEPNNKDFQKMEIVKTQRGIKFGYQIGKNEQSRPIIVGNATNENEIRSFVHSIAFFGDKCDIVMQKIRENEYEIEVPGDGDLATCSCCPNFAYKILYNEDKSRIAFIYLNQESIFRKGQDFEKGYYDSEIARSFSWLE